MDARKLLSHVKHNAYNPKQMTQAEIDQRHKAFLQVMVKYARAKEANGLVAAGLDNADEEKEESDNSGSVGS